MLVVQGANPAVMNPAQATVLAGLERDDLFTVVHDQVLTDTARYADVVLPATTHFETRDVVGSYGSFVGQHDAPPSSIGSARAAPTTSSAPGWRPGWGSRPARARPSIPIPSACASIVLPGGAPSRRVGPGAGHRRCSSETSGPTTPWEPGPAARRPRAQATVPLRVPRYVELDARAPLTLVSPANVRTINSIFGDVEGRRPWCTCTPTTPLHRGLVDGQDVTVMGTNGSLDTSVAIDEDLRPGVASMPKGLWRRAVGGGLTANAFAPDTLNDLAGGACFNDARVDVRAR